MFIEYEISKSFSKHHGCLLDIAFEVKKAPMVGDSKLDVACITPGALIDMDKMVKVEFAASIAKEREGSKADKTGTEKEHPRPFDIFIMERILGRGNTNLAVCLPMNKPKGEFMWYDRNGNFWPLDPPSHSRRVGSLSGPARTLQALHQVIEPNSLMAAAMRRDKIVRVVQDVEELSSSLEPTITDALNNLKFKQFQLC